LGVVKSDACEPRAGYLGYVAHELRNPLSTALWCTELLGSMQAADRGGPRGVKLALTARRAIGRLSRLIEDHLLAERLGAGGMAVRVEELPLGELLAEAAARAAGPAGADVEAPEGLRIQGDRALWARALEALVAAAARGGSRVRAQVLSAPGGVVLTIRGSPVGPEDLELPRRGSPSDPSGASLALVVAGAVAASQGASLAASDGALLLTWPGSRP
jgi:K+-sensing histidine kinase KdpD